MISTSFQIGSAKAGPGERANGYIKVFEYIDGSPIMVPVTIVNGAKPGPRLWATACEHADEPYGALAVIEAAKRMDPKKISGTLIGVPVVNTTALNFGTRHSPIDWVDMEHGYPGKEVSYFSERLTYKLFSLMCENADCVINYHGTCAGVYDSIDYALVECPPDVPEDFREKNRKIAEAYGLEFIMEMPSKREMWEADSLLSQKGLHPLMPMMYPQLNKREIPAIGALVGLGSGSVDRHVQGIFNVMMHLGMIEGTPKISEKYTRLSGYLAIRPKNSGMFKTNLKVGDRVKKGQHIATIYNIFGEEIEKIKAPVDGLISLVNIYPFINAGQYECYAFEIFW